MSKAVLENITLQGIKPTDLKEILFWSINSEESYFVLHSPLAISSESIILELKSNNVDSHVIYDKKGKKVGLVKAYSINDTAKRASVTFTMKPSGFNTKYFSEAVLLLIERLIVKRKTDRFFAYALSTEIEMKKVLTGLNFKRAGIYKEHVFNRNKYHDLEVFSLDVRKNKK